MTHVSSSTEPSMARHVPDVSLRGIYHHIQFCTACQRQIHAVLVRSDSPVTNRLFNYIWSHAAEVRRSQFAALRALNG
ncbi:MAG: hypothetical protein ACYTAO_02465 [Planctomycetota bacterium]